MLRIFYNEAGRLRSGWRAAFFVFAFLFLFSLISPLVVLALRALGVPLEDNVFIGLIFSSVIGLPAALFLGWLCGRVFENLPWRALGAAFTRNWLKDLALGVLIGFASISLAVLTAMLFGGLRLVLNPEATAAAFLSTVLLTGVVFVLGAAFEEAVMRGYIFQTFVRAGLTVFALVFTSLLFASIHNANPSANYLSWTNTFIAGIWLGAAYLRTRTLWLAFGLHFSWNWFQGAFFGIEVSGLTEIAEAPLMREVDGGPAWLTGGEYGLEGGVACTVALIASTALVWFLPVLSADPGAEVTAPERTGADRTEP